MEELVGISFTNRSLSLVRVAPGESHPELISSHEILYPFPFEFNALLKEENLSLLVEKVAQFVQNNHLQGRPCNVSLPMFLAQMKRAPLLKDVDVRIMQKHLVWELENINTHAIEESKVIKLAKEFRFGSYEESAFVLIPKLVIQKVKNFVEQSGLKINRLLLDSDTLLKFLNAFNLLHPAKNQLIFQIDVFNVTLFQYLDGAFFSYDLFSLAEKDKIFEQKMVDLIQQQVTKFQKLVNTLPGYENPLNVYVTRLITDNLSRRLKELEFSVEELRLDRILEKETSSNLESFAVML